MPDNEFVVSDTSPLLNLALTDNLSLIKSQFSNITIPVQVWEELARGESGFDAIQELRDSEFLTVVPVEESNLFTEIFQKLDFGETAAICYAIEQDADLLLLDERDGRQVARRHDLNVTGVVGILLRGAKNGHIDLQHELDSLREVGFWLSDELYDKILSEANT